MEKTEIYNQLKTPPKEVLKTITGGRLNGMTDIKPQWRLEKMTEIFGPVGIGWYYNEIKRDFREYDGQVAVFIDIQLFYRVERIDPLTERVTGFEWSMPVTGSGGSMFAAREKSGLHVSDEAVKMATTDALSVAMKQLGMGADVYMGLPMSKYDSKPQEPPKPLKEYMNLNHIKYQAALESIKAGKTTVAKIEAAYNLSPEVKRTLTELENTK